MKANIPKQGGAPSNMNQILKQAQQMQEQMAAAQEELAKRSYNVSVGGGAVELSMDGKHQVTFLKISPEVVDPEDVEMLSDLITGAVNECIRKVDEDNEKTMAAISGDMPSIPGMPGGMPQF